MAKPCDVKAVSERIDKNLVRARRCSEWPDSVAALAGIWKDFPSLAEIRARMGEDVAREEMTQVDVW